MRSLTPMTILAIVTVIIMLTITGYASLNRAYEQSNAPIICKQIIDYNDKQDIMVRGSNYLTERTVYKGYDICSYKNGTDFSNTSLGYRTEVEFGILWGGTR
jgi:hypothetical protein